MNRTTIRDKFYVFVGEKASGGLATSKAEA